ncbi:MAG: helix-turn-helix transcriptional regulator [Anaerolineaceae bacterium]|nr:helix-turn-helix transcriptional regulator [Anaerolineaceae bacterium]
MTESSTLREEIAQLHANMCNGIADTNRILIIYTLADGPKNVGEMAKALDLPQPTVSRHLKIMRDCGIVLAERAGQSVTYSLKDARILQALDLLRSVMTDTFENRAALAREGSVPANR